MSENSLLLTFVSQIPPSESLMHHSSSPTSHHSYAHYHCLKCSSPSLVHFLVCFFVFGTYIYGLIMPYYGGTNEIDVFGCLGLVVVLTGGLIGGVFGVLLPTTSTGITMGILSSLLMSTVNQLCFMWEFHRPFISSCFHITSVCQFALPHVLVYKSGITFLSDFDVACTIYTTTIIINIIVFVIMLIITLYIYLYVLCVCGCVSCSAFTHGCKDHPQI